MLDGIAPEQFSEWQAAYLLDPWDDDWRQAGVVAAEIRNLLTILLSALGGEKVTESDLVQPADFVPGLLEELQQKKTSRRIPPEQAEQQMRARWQ